MTAMIFLFLSTTFVAIILALAAHILPNRNSDGEKNSPYECGFESTNTLLVLLLSLSFFFSSHLIFTLWSSNSTPIFHFLAANFVTHPSILIPISLAFMIILTIGLIFEWINGGLEWAE
uniref:NADH-ubiquinone oxidoreductase chain 3 n=1 Tax=Loxechinus albus TaxID=240836 RepID=A0A139YGZ1_9ECHO|nr:NADH dehydrogenase subunit 3 [Loxechinus albus]